MKNWTARDWRFYRNYLIGLSCVMERGTIEWRNVIRRADWVDSNRL